MKKILAVAMAAALLGGAVSMASAHGSWGRGSDDEGRGQGRRQMMYDRDFDGKGRGFGPGSCRENGPRRGGCDSPGACLEDGERGRRFGKVESPEAAAEIVAGRIERRGNPNLKVGKVTEAGRDYEVEIVTQDGSLANKVFVEKRTGRTIPAYR